MGLLKPKEEAFCRYYIESYNATDAYSKAYNNPHKETCRVNGCKLLKKEAVKNCLKEL